MIYFINKKTFTSLIVLVLLLTISISLFSKTPTTLSAFSDYPIDDDLYFPAFDVTIDKYDKVVALTFDDGPSRAYTSKILDYLEARNVVATFVVLVANLENNDDLLTARKSVV